MFKKGRGVRAIVDSIDHWSAFDGEKVDDFIRGTDHEITGQIYFVVSQDH